jgi:4-diphosphocytidyl-2-C-methyl-D-erythritol kinase
LKTPGREVLNIISLHLIVFPNCKINLGLRVLRKRADGFHDLETAFYPLAISDALEIVSRPHHAAGHDKEPVKFTNTGIKISGPAENNLCVQAYHLLKKDFHQLPAIDMHLHKTIPLGAGLGGGSADGAFTLKLLNDKYRLNLSTPELIGYAARLGSDCPFFIINKPCFASSRGEMLEVITLDLSTYQLILINPGIHVETRWAFSEIIPHDRSEAEPLLPELLSTPPGEWKNKLINDFELPVFRKYPQIRMVKDYMYEQGALYASMSGSGSTVFGIFKQDITPKFDFPPAYTVITNAASPRARLI